VASDATTRNGLINITLLEFGAWNLELQFSSENC
jgi:hypothetical protein